MSDSEMDNGQAPSGILDEILRSLGLLFTTVVIGFFVIWLILRPWKSKDDRVHVHKATEQNIKNGTPTLGQADGRKPVEPDIPLCSTQTPTDTPNNAVNGTAEADGGHMPRAWIPPDTVWTWKGKKVINVKFFHIEKLAKWTIGDGQTMNTDTILRYANTWSDISGGKIPRFVEVEDGETAQIRVSFNDDKLCNSELGMRAQGIKAPKPTMNLDLGFASVPYKKHVIKHEFGHALGLGHEHQRSDFWSCIKPFTDTEKMRKALGVTEEVFAAQWKETADFETCQDPTDYDPYSIMHYWFEVDWLTNGYSDKAKIERDLKSGILSEKVAKALLGIHQRKVLADSQSDLDIKVVKEAYGGVTGEVIEQPPLAEDGIPKQRSGAPVTTDSDVFITTGTDADNCGGNGHGAQTKTGVSKDQKSASDSASAPQPDKQSEVVIKQEYDVEVTNTYLGRMEWTEDGKKQVVGIYDEASHKWPKIGENLGIDPGILVGIGRDGRDERDRVIKVLEKWYENACRLPNHDQYPKTWGGLLKLLDDSDLGQLAKKVQKALLEQKQPIAIGGMMQSAPPAPANRHNGGRDRLRIDDLNIVRNGLWDARADWKNIGGALKIDRGTIDSINRQHRENAGDCLGEVIATWLRGASTPEKPVTWAALVEALEQKTLQATCGNIVEEIRKEHIKVQ